MIYRNSRAHLRYFPIFHPFWDSNLIAILLQIKEHIGFDTLSYNTSLSFFFLVLWLSRWENSSLISESLMAPLCLFISNCKGTNKHFLTLFTNIICPPHHLRWSLAMNLRHATILHWQHYFPKALNWLGRNVSESMKCFRLLRAKQFRKLQTF